MSQVSQVSQAEQVYAALDDLEVLLDSGTMHFVCFETTGNEPAEQTRELLQLELETTRCEHCGTLITAQSFNKRWCTRSCLARNSIACRWNRREDLKR